VENLTEAARYESKDGVYAVFATWHGLRVVRLTSHLDRLEHSARSAGFPLRLDRPWLCAALRQLVHDAGLTEAKFRISATPGSSLLMISAEPFAGPPEDLRRTGVRCGTVDHSARATPLVKRTSWIIERSRLGGADIYEGLLVNDSGRILEGVSSNFFVIRSGPDETSTLQTADNGILPGITRSIVLEVATTFLRVDLTAPAVAELDECDEAFLTSASRGIIPVVSVDGRDLGSGRPGPVTRALIEAFDRRAEELEEPL